MGNFDKRDFHFVNFGFSYFSYENFDKSDFHFAAREQDLVVLSAKVTRPARLHKAPK